MAVNAYIQSGITQLHSALDHMRQEMDGLRHQTDQGKQRLQQDIHGLELAMHADEVGLEQADDDAKPLFVERLAHNHHEIDSKKAQLSALDSELQRAVQSKTQVYNTLENLTHQLDVILGSPEVH